MKFQLEDLEISENSTLNDAIHKLNKNGSGFLAVISKERKLIGIITDGDIRRAFLNQKNDFHDVINKKPIVMKNDIPKKYVITKLKEINQRYMPIVDDKFLLCDIIFINEDEFNINKNDVVIMAGGVGARMGNLTKNIPKPMLPLGKKPMLEIIITEFVKQGFPNITISVNYKSSIIMNYFEDGKKLGAKITYIEEDKKMGTGGSLSLLPNDISETFIVINGDVITNVDFNKLLSFHQHYKQTATICARPYEVKIPYGVVTTNDESCLLQIIEKPNYKYNVNSGIYAFNKKILKYVPKDTFFDLPEIFKTLLKNNIMCKIFEIDDFWYDVGMPEIYKKINRNFDYYDY